MAQPLTKAIWSFISVLLCIWVTNLIIETNVSLEVENGHKASQKLENGILLADSAMNWNCIIPMFSLKFKKDVVQMLTKVMLTRSLSGRFRELLDTKKSLNRK